MRICTSLRWLAETPIGAPTRPAARALVSLLAVLPAVALGQTTRTQRGDTVVITTTGPGQAGAPLRPVELLRIGGDSHETTFGQVSLLTAMPDGGVLLVDHRSLDGLIIRQFDGNGRFVRNIGRPGQGPGEYGGSGLNATVAQGGDIVVRDGNRSISRFAPDGRLVRSFPLHHNNGSTNEVVAADDGTIWVRAPFVRGPAPFDGIMRPMQRWSADGRLLDSLVDARQWMSPGFDPAIHRRWWHPTPDGLLLHARADVFGYLLSDPAGRLPPTLVRAERRPLRFEGPARAEQERQRNFILDSCPPMGQAPAQRVRLPDTLPVALGSAARDPAGRVWVTVSAPFVRSAPVVTGSCGRANAPPITFTSQYGQTQRYAVFAPDGALLGEVDFPPRVRVVHGRDHVWAVIRDEDDVPTVVKYRIPGVH